MPQWSRALVLACALSCVACGDTSLDTTKFENVNAAAAALQADVTASGGIGSPEFARLLEQFRGDVSTLRAQVSGPREKGLLDAYGRAAEAYGYFLRFKRLEAETVREMVLLTGANRPIASRYQLPTESRGGGRWVNRKDALKVFRDQAERELAVAADLLSVH
jgi:hypothetical protein